MNMLCAKRLCQAVFGDDPDRHPIALVGADVAVLNEEIATLKIGHHPGFDRFVLMRGDRFIDLSPPDFVLAAWFLDDEFVIR